MFKKGVTVGKFKEDELLDRLKEEVLILEKEYLEKKSLS